MFGRKEFKGMDVLCAYRQYIVLVLAIVLIVISLVYTMYVFLVTLVPTVFSFIALGPSPD